MTHPKHQNNYHCLCPECIDRRALTTLREHTYNRHLVKYEYKNLVVSLCDPEFMEQLNSEGKDNWRVVHIHTIERNIANSFLRQSSLTLVYILLERPITE